MKYREKPVIIEAVRWTGNNLKEIIAFTGLHPSASRWTWEQYEEVVKNDGLKIFTRSGKVRVYVGEWIIKHPDGSIIPCDNKLFTEIYEAE